MAKPPIEIGVASETKAFRQGIETGVIAPLENAIKTMKELGDADGAAQLEQALEDAQRASKSLEREIERTAETIEREFRDSYRRMGQSADDGFDRAKRGAQEFKQEAIQNFSEVSSSFDGDLRDIGDLAQGTFGGLAAGLSGISLPAAIAVGALGAVGGAVIQGIADSAEQAQERYETALANMIAAGQAAFTEEQILQGVQDLIGDAGKLEQAQKDAAATGLDLAIVLRAQAGDQAALATVVDTARTKYQEATDATAAWRDTHRGTNGELEHTVQVTGNLAGRYTEMVNETNKAIDSYNIYNAVVAEGTARTDDLTQSVDRVPADKSVTVTVDTSGAERALDDLASRRRTIRLDVTGYTGQGQRVI